MNPNIFRGWRLPVAAVLVVAGALAPGAGAAPALPTSCHLLTDRSGDTQSLVPDNDQELDLLGGDIATSNRWVTAVIRLKALTAEDVTEPAGRIYEFDFTANGKNFILMGALLPGGSEFEAYISGQRLQQNKSGARAATGIGALHGTVDVTHKEIWLTGPVSIFKKYASLEQTTINHLAMFTYRAHGESLRALPTGRTVDISSSVGIGVDEAWSSARYTPRYPSCIPAGYGAR